MFNGDWGFCGGDAEADLGMCIVCPLQASQ